MGDLVVEVGQAAVWDSSKHRGVMCSTPYTYPQTTSKGSNSSVLKAVLSQYHDPEHQNEPKHAGVWTGGVRVTTRVEEGAFGVLVLVRLA